MKTFIFQGKWLLAVLPIVCFLTVTLAREFSVGIPLHYPPNITVGDSAINALGDGEGFMTESEVIEATNIALQSPQAKRELNEIIKYSRWNPRGSGLYLALTPVLLMVFFAAARRKWPEVASLGVGVIFMFLFSEVYVGLTAVGFGSIGLVLGWIYASSTIPKRK